MSKAIEEQRYEPYARSTLGKVLLVEGHREQAFDYLEKTRDSCRLSDEKFASPYVFGALALAAPREDSRRAALRDGERICKDGAWGQSTLAFYRDAMEACIHNENWRGALHYADELEEFTRPEPIAWSDFWSSGHGHSPPSAPVT